MIQEDYVTFEQAKELKELGFPQIKRACGNFYYPDGILGGFDVHCTAFNFDESCSVCTPLSLAQKWLIEEKQLYIYVIPITETALSEKIQGFSFYIYVEEDGGIVSDYIRYDTPEEAISAGIDKCIELLNLIK